MVQGRKVFSGLRSEDAVHFPPSRPPCNRLENDECRLRGVDAHLGGIEHLEHAAEIARSGERRADETLGRLARHQMWIDRPSTASAASLVVSANFGCACTGMAVSSDEPRCSMASTT